MENEFVKRKFYLMQNFLILNTEGKNKNKIR